MNSSLFERLERRCAAINSLLCVGLDPHPDDLPERSAEAARDFCLRVMDATGPFAAAFKPNSAFFEIYGGPGLEALHQIVSHAGDEIPVIWDSKRGDIASSSQAYAEAAFHTLGVSALTANPYLGKDAIEPFIADPTHAVFLLCKTSNPGAGDVQDLFARGEPVYVHVARLAQQWNTRGNIGLVIGATYPEVLGELRQLVPDLWFLVPGAVTQGGNLHEAVQAGIREDGLGLLLSASRAISRAEDSRRAAEELCDAINQARKLHKKESVFIHKRLADDLLQLGCVRFGEFTLKSGKVSPIYIDLRRLVGDPNVLARVANAYIELLRKLKFNRIAGLPYAALPIATAISLQSGWPLIYPRRETKGYGTQEAIEGPYTVGETAVVIDDLITTGGTKLEGIEKLESAGLKVNDTVVLIDRRSEPGNSLKGKEINLNSVFRLTDLLSYWHQTNAITSLQYSDALAFLQAG